MHETFESMVTTQLTEINKTLGEHSIALGRIEQKELNGEKQEAKEEQAKAHRLLVYRVLIGVGVFMGTILTVIDKLDWI